MQHLLHDHSSVQNSIQDLTEQNVFLERSLQAYGDKYKKLETEIETINHRVKLKTPVVMN